MIDNKLAALISEREKIEAKIASREEALKEEIRVKITELLEPYGYTIGDLYAVRGQRARANATPGLYQDPNNSENTWGGRGRMPAWLTEKLEAGAKVEDFKVGE